MAFIYFNVSHLPLPSLLIRPTLPSLPSLFSSLGPSLLSLCPILLSPLPPAVGASASLLYQLAVPPLAVPLDPLIPVSPLSLLCSPSSDPHSAFPSQDCSCYSCMLFFLPLQAIFSSLLVSFFLSFSKGNPGIRELLNQSHKGQSVCHTAVSCESDCSFIAFSNRCPQSRPKAGDRAQDTYPHHQFHPRTSFSCVRTHVHVTTLTPL